MPCEHPKSARLQQMLVKEVKPGIKQYRPIDDIKARQYGYKPTYKIKILKKDAVPKEYWEKMIHLPEIITIPCGKCLACRLDKAKEWATRSIMEAKLHNKNCFITITYDNKHLPKVAPRKRCVN